MNNLELVRPEDQSIETKGVMSVINDDDATLLKIDTLELPWKDNQHGISCIPKGVYLCKKVPPSHIPYEHIAIQNVQNRDGVCIHAGNFAAGKQVDILGCIIVGDKYADINGDGIDDIVDSKVTFAKLMALMPDEFKITIK